MENERKLTAEEREAFRLVGEDAPDSLSTEQTVSIMRALQKMRPEIYGHIDIDALVAEYKEAEAAQEGQG